MRVGNSDVKMAPKIKKIKKIYEKRIIVVISGFIIEIMEEYKRNNFEYNICKAKVKQMLYKMYLE